ncbi:hypothetical protein Aduo_013676 [Ancylostoma duodenale]
MQAESYCCGWYDRLLPKPPVPSLDHTLDRYLEYAELVAEGQNRNIQMTLDAVEEFRRLGVVYQQRLEKLAEAESNWINQFWLPEMYFRSRVPLPVYVSPAYVFPQQHFKDEDDWLRYTTLLICGMLEFRSKIGKKQLKREFSTGKHKVEMCMQQYEDLFSCYRQPALVEDIQVKKKRSDESEHILVMCRNQAFAVYTRVDGRLLTFGDIMFQLREVLRLFRATEDPVIAVGASGAGDRDTAALFWSELQKVELNRTSLKCAQEAIFVVCLDHDDTNRTPPQSPSKPQEHEEELVRRAKHLLIGGGTRGNGMNRWYDATIQLIVNSNGTNGLCIEHSTAEGIVSINMAESALRYERENREQEQTEEAEKEIHVKPLSWDLNSEAMILLEEQKATMNELKEELDLEVLIFNDFGRDFMKTHKFSPDGFVQLALQLAHFKLHGYLVCTYETASLRRFRSGRVDNIRANTREPLEWVKAMKGESSKETKLALMKKAAEKQAKVTEEIQGGFGIDNHLYALFVLAKQSLESGEIPELPGFFRDPIWDELMRFPLSTSQVTTSPDIPDSFLCYGSLVRDGYGCSYNLQNDAIIFVPSAFKSNTHTDVAAFKEAIRGALHDMKGLLTN